MSTPARAGTVDIGGAMAQSSTYDFFCELAQRMQNGESLAEAVSHDETGAVTPERVQRAQRQLEAMRARCRLCPDDGV